MKLPARSGAASNQPGFVENFEQKHAANSFLRYRHRACDHTSQVLTVAASRDTDRRTGQGASEVRMSGRRSYYRYVVTNTGGCLRVVRDVTTWRGNDNEFVVISEEPEATGEFLTLERVVNGAVMAIQVCVIESHPTIVNGSVRYCLRLRSSDAADSCEWDDEARAH